MKRKLQRSIRKSIVQRSMALAVAFTAASGVAVFADHHEKDSKPGQAQAAGQQSQHQDKSHKFIKEALKGNQMEVQMGKLAQQHGQNQQIKQLGQQLVTDHSAAMQKLQSIAQQKGIQVDQSHTSTSSPADDSALGGPAGADKGKSSYKGEHGDKHAKHMMEMDQLKSKSGAEFDKAFARMAVKHHKKDVAKYEKASRDVQDTALKGYIDETLPKLRNHLTMSQNAAKAVGLTETELTSLEREINTEDAAEAAGSPAGAQESSSNSLNQDNSNLRKDNSTTPSSDESSSGNAPESESNVQPESSSSPQDNKSSSEQPQASISTSDQGDNLASASISSDTATDGASSTLNSSASLDTESESEAVGGPAGAESETSSSSSDTQSSGLSDNSSNPSGSFNQESSSSTITSSSSSPNPSGSISSDSNSSLEGSARIGDSSASADVDVETPDVDVQANTPDVDVDVDAKDYGVTEAVDRTFEEGDGKVLGVPSKKGDNKVLGLSTDKNDGKFLGIIPVPGKNRDVADADVDVDVDADTDSAVGGPGVAVSGQASSGKAVTFNELPSSVKQAIRTEGGVEQPRNIRKLSVYEVQVNKNGQMKTLHVTEDGKVYQHDSSKSSVGGQSSLEQGSSSQDSSSPSISVEGKASAE